MSVGCKNDKVDWRQETEDKKRHPNGNSSIHVVSDWRIHKNCEWKFDK